MGIEKKPFQRYTIGDKPKIDSLTLWLNEQERKNLEASKELLQQPKDSTALKELAHIGYLYLIGGPVNRYISGRVARNVYNNKKLGIPMNLENSAKSSGESPENLTE